MDMKIKSKEEVDALIRRLHKLDVEIRYHSKKDPEANVNVINGKIHSSEAGVIIDSDTSEIFISDVYLLQNRFDGATPRQGMFSYMHGWVFSITYRMGEYRVSIYNFQYDIRVFVNGISLDDFINNKVTLYDLI